MLMPMIRNNVFDDLFDDFDNSFCNFTSYPDIKTNSLMRTDVKETEAGYELAIDLPGFDKENVKAELNDGYLTITADSDKSTEDKDKKHKYIRRERYTGHVSRSFYVGDAVEKEDIKAKFDKGVLTLLVPKKEAKKELPADRLISIE
jgi:HSP20 family molecular chaperone IbpA